MTCWRCTNETTRLHRCHIVPDALGGKAEPSNLVLLCARCHRENPDVSDPGMMWSWIRQSVNLRRKYLGDMAAATYGNYWIARAAEEYERLFDRCFIDDLRSTNISQEQIVAEYKRLARDTATTVGGEFSSSTTASIMLKALHAPHEWVYLK